MTQKPNIVIKREKIVVEEVRPYKTLEVLSGESIGPPDYDVTLGVYAISPRTKCGFGVEGETEAEHLAYFIRRASSPIFWREFVEAVQKVV